MDTVFVSEGGHHSLMSIYNLYNRWNQGGPDMATVYLQGKSIYKVVFVYVCVYTCVYVCFISIKIVEHIFGRL